MPVTKDQYIRLTLLREIAMNPAAPLVLLGPIKTIIESKNIEKIQIETTTNGCTAIAFIQMDSKPQAICLEPINLVELYIILAFRYHPMPNFYAKEDLFIEIERPKHV